MIEDLERCGFRLIESREIEKIPFIFMVIMPHEENENRIMLRAARRKIMINGLIVIFRDFMKMKTT